MRKPSGVRISGGVPARPLTDVKNTLGKLSLVLGLVALGGIGLAVVLGFFVSRAALSPVTRLTKAAESVAQTLDLDHRMEVVGDHDLDRLARSFNTMMDALQQSLDSQQQLVADASHELRTPLTSLRTNIEVLLHGDDLTQEQRHALTDSVVFQLDEITRLMGDLIDLARESENETRETETFRLDEIVEGVVARAAHRSERVTITYESVPCQISGVSDSIERAVLNLIENAIKWTPEGGQVSVRLTGEGEVLVKDSGPGIDPTDIDHIFDRFYRSRDARGMPGSGLGLSIVKQIAENHDGTITATTSASGAQFCLDLRARAVTMHLV